MRCYTQMDTFFQFEYNFQVLINTFDLHEQEIRRDRKKTVTKLNTTKEVRKKMRHFYEKL